MAFDPDAYLSQAAAPTAAPAAFDPDAYLKATSSGIPAPRRTGTRADQIPGYGRPVPASTAAPERPESGFFGKLLSPVETAVALGTSAITAPIVEAAKIGGTIFSGKYGTQAGIRAGEETGRKVQQFFQPALSPEAEAQTQAIGNFLSSTGLQGVPLNVLGDLQRGLTPALRATADTARAPIAARAENIKQARIEQSYANAPMIEAAQSAQRIGGAVPPAISNPTRANVIKGKLVGPELESQFAKKNEIAVTDKVRKDLGIKPNEKLIPEVDEATGKLNIDSPITRAVEQASKPYEVIRKMDALTTPKESIDALTALKRTDIIGGDTKVAAINGLIDDAVTKLQQTTSGAFSGVGGGPVAVGRSGAAILDDIRSLRRDAQATYRAQKINPDPLASAKADTQMAIANILEDIIDANAPTPKVLRELREARTRIAQIYEHERAINYGQQKIDPQVYAKLYEERKGGMTGLNADIAKAASMFPDYFTLTPAEIKNLPRITRGGLGAAIGAVIGSPLGPAGALAGTAAGIGVGGAGSAVAARRMATPAYQRANAMPADYRPVPLGANPADINYAPNQMVPYNFAQETFTPPNFVLRSGQEAPAYTPPSYPQLTQFGDFETTVNALRNQEARAAERSRAAGRQAEAQQAAAEAATRKPAGRGVELVFDTAGNLVEAPVAGTGGVMPSALESAVAKMSGQVIEQPSTTFKTQTISPKTGTKPYTRITKREGETTFERGVSQAFAMTAEEKIAWNKAKADLAEVMPGMKTLSDEAIAARMNDVKWAEQAVANARAKADSLVRQEALLTEQLANRNNLRMMAKEIEAKQKQLAKIKTDRERMINLAEQLQDALGARPVKRGGQGPKTRAFQRNMLAPEQEIQNALATRIDLTGMANK
jgi:hypothetical protein